LVAKFSAFGWHVERIDGHDTAGIEASFRKLNAIADRPKVIIADTVKGKGVSFMEGTAIDSDVDMFRFHSGAPKADEYRRAVLEIEASIARRLSAFDVAPVQIEVEPRPAIAPSIVEQKRLVPAYTEALIAL